MPGYDYSAVSQTCAPSVTTTSLTTLLASVLSGGGALIAFIIGVVGRKLYYEANTHQTDLQLYPVPTLVRDSLHMGDFSIKDSEVYNFVNLLSIPGLTHRKDAEAHAAAAAIVDAMNESDEPISRPSCPARYFCCCTSSSKGSFNVDAMNARAAAIAAEVNKKLSSSAASAKDEKESNAIQYTENPGPVTRPEEPV